MPGSRQKQEKKKTTGRKKYDYGKILELHEQGLKNVDIEKKLGYPKSAVAYVICMNRKRLQEQKPAAEPEVKETKNPVPEPVKKFRYDPKEVIVERSDDGKRLLVTERKPTPLDKQPVKVCMKNCVVCKFSSPGGYCDYLTITGQSRNDKTGLCTHRELRK